MIDNRLWEMFPETPERFQKKVKQSVADQLTIERKKNTVRVPRAAAVTVICILLAGTTVGAANISKLKEYISNWGHTLPEENVVTYAGSEQADMVQGTAGETSADANSEDGSTDDEQDKMSYNDIRGSLSELEKKNLDIVRNNYIEHALMSEEDAEKKICDEWVAEPFLLMDEVYMDGSSLYYSAHLADGCNIKPIDSKDHTFVNGVDCLNEFFEETDEPGHYVGSIDLTMNASSDINFVNQGDELAVMLNLYVDENSGETRLFTFSDKNWNGSVDTKDLSGTVIELEKYGSVRMDKLLVSPSKITVKVTYTMSGDGLDEMLTGYGYSNDNQDLITQFNFKDSNGKRYYMRGTEENGYKDRVVNASSGGHIEKVSDGAYRWDFEFVIEQNFDMNSDTLILIPCTQTRDADGKFIPGTEKEIPELSFEVKLK
ncbi:MAG: hypothetical protein IJ661_06205 [Lachnospiraceae bacterium]|nr:hypothetical protein [Lachnospiraceae bacterium]